MDELSKSSPIIRRPLEYGRPEDSRELSGRIELILVMLFVVDVTGVLLTLFFRWLICDTWTNAAMCGFAAAIYLVLALISRIRNEMRRSHR